MPDKKANKIPQICFRTTVKKVSDLESIAESTGRSKTTLADLGISIIISLHKKGKLDSFLADTIAG
jgi:hypothetical protein